VSNGVLTSYVCCVPVAATIQNIGTGWGPGRRSNLGRWVQGPNPEEQRAQINPRTARQAAAVFHMR
jgi:hypothetical protein